MDNGELLLAVADGGSRAEAVPVTSLGAAGLMERQHLQEWIVVQLDAEQSDEPAVDVTAAAPEDVLD